MKRIVRPRALASALVVCLALAVPGRAQEEDTQAKIRTSIDTMIQAIEEGNDPMRNRMFFELRIIGNESVPALVELMKDSRVKVREYAVHTVSYIDDERWIDPVVAMIRNEPEASTRSMSSNGCGASARFVIAVWRRTRSGSTPRLRWPTCTCSDAGCCHGSGVSRERDDGPEEAENGLQQSLTARFPPELLMLRAKFIIPDLYTPACAEVP